MKQVRRDAGHNVIATVDTIEIDFADLSNVPKKLVFEGMGKNKCAVQVRHIECSGISGNWTVQQSFDKSGSDSFDMEEGSLTMVAGANTTVQVAKATKRVEFFTLELPATLPASGRVKITISMSRD